VTTRKAEADILASRGAPAKEYRWELFLAQYTGKPETAAINVVANGKARQLKRRNSSNYGHGATTPSKSAGNLFGTGKYEARKI
jgi:hypothetical protein